MQSSERHREKCNKPDRLEYLHQLVTEFQTSQSKDAKEQVLANLANFAYDPLNYIHFRTLNILDVFLNNLTSGEENLIKFSVGGLCNLCLDPLNKDYILKNGTKKLVELLNHDNEEIILSAITTLIYLITPDSKPEITSPEVIKSVLKLRGKKNARIKNLAEIFINDFCSAEQIREASYRTTTEIDRIPLPDSA